MSDAQSADANDREDKMSSLLTRDPFVMAGIALLSVAVFAHFGRVYPSALAGAGVVYILLGVSYQWFGVENSG